MGHFGTIMFLKLEIYILNWLRTCTSVDQIPSFMFLCVIVFGKKSLMEKMQQKMHESHSRKYQSEGGAVRNFRNNQEHLV